MHKMECCTARAFSWIVAILHLLLTPLGAFYLIFTLCLSEEEKRHIFNNYDTIKDDVFYLHLFGSIYLCLALAATIILIMGLRKHNRPKYLCPFVFIIYLGGCYWLVRIIMTICRGVKADKPFGEVALEALPYLLLCLFQGLCRAPVEMLRTQMRNARFEQPERRDSCEIQQLNGTAKSCDV